MDCDLKEYVLIGISGKANAGKDTLADLIVRERPGYGKLSFAQPLKNFAARVYGFSHDQLWGPSECRDSPDPRFFSGSPAWEVADKEFRAYSEEWMNDLGVVFLTVPKAVTTLYDTYHDLRRSQEVTLTPRSVLQAFGLWGRSISSELWVNATIRLSQEYVSRRRGWDGVVYPDVRFRNEFSALRRNRALLVRIRSSKRGANLDVSETEQDSIPDSDFDIVIHNNKDLSALKSEVENILWRAEKFSF